MKKDDWSNIFGSRPANNINEPVVDNSLFAAGFQWNPVVEKPKEENLKEKEKIG